MDNKWLVIYAVPYSISIEEFSTYEEAKQHYEKEKNMVSNMEVLYFAEVKEIYKT